MVACMRGKALICFSFGSFSSFRNVEALSRHSRAGGNPALRAAARKRETHVAATVTDQQPLGTALIPNPTPDEMLLADFIEPMGLSQNGLARAIGVPPRRINETILGKRSITADTDLRLFRHFGLSEGFWLGVQADYHLLERRRQIGAELARITPHPHAASA